jgi:hypothetical protein
LSEIFKSIERNSSAGAVRGFYVMGMKKDPRTGHYVGVATWVSRDQPLPGSRTFPEPKKPVGFENPSEPLGPVIGVQREARPEQDVPTEVPQKINVERRAAKSTMFDPYDAYEL